MNENFTEKEKIFIDKVEVKNQEISAIGNFDSCITTAEFNI